MANVTITQRKSAIGRPPAQRRTLRALGLRKIGHTVTKSDSKDLRGMIFVVRHLVEVEEGQ
ncbi:MAG TPA: 50S ribosomal protein L30 [Actinomycetota bacterium]|jgi:large subunit ribosomal protein L30|nr:50S ribosomal protein L30 [Actinomycetota bacterium]